MIDRRTFLASAAGAGLFVSAEAGAADLADAALAAVLQNGAETLLRDSPETATGLGFDQGAHAALRSRLDDRSPDAKRRNCASARAALSDLSRLDRQKLSASARLDLDVAVFVYQTLADGLARPGYIDLNLRPSPYVVSQMNGAYYWLPGIIGTQHPLETRADVEAWYARLEALATAIDQETARIEEDAARGVVPPGFILDKTIAQLAALRDSDPNASALLAPARARAKAKGLGDLGPRGEALFKRAVVPALSRQIAALQALKPHASDIAGIWRLPDGEALYAAALRANTTRDLSPGDLHQAGLVQVEALTRALDASLAAQGLTQGSVGERLGVLDRDPRYHATDDGAGRARLLAFARQQLDDITARLPRAFLDTRVDPIVVRRVPEAVEQGSPGAFYEEGAAGEPSVFYLNLSRPDEQSLWRLPTLAHHEGVPGHHFQYGRLHRAGALSLFRRMVLFSAYTEGWALYAEQVADEVGCYEHDPLGRIGYLQSELFRAGRIVVDTGLHHKRWTRQQAIDYMVTQIGEAPGGAAREIDRYCVYPGQACSFKVGANSIVAAREVARARLGASFDVRKFHDLILRSGPVPMAVLAAMTAQWDGA